MPAEEELAVALEEIEYLLIDVPCGEIPKWQTLAQHAPPQSVMNKLESLDYFGDVDLLTLENAAGTVLNMDKFSVNVINLPNGMTAEDLLNHIRLNINDFINTDYSEFRPYDGGLGYSYDEGAIWNSTDPLGAILSIDIPGDEGSVIVSDYNSNNWVFSTLTDPINFDHPVSGNRKFGFAQNADGSYTFYTRGVDRFTQRVTGELAAEVITLGNPFSGADNLWESFQNGIKNYVNQHGGSVTINTPTKYRPDWQKIKDVLNRQEQISSLNCN